MTDIASITRDLRFLEEEGIWISADHPDISYPSGGHDTYFEIEERSFWFKHRNDCIVEIFKRFPPGGAIYDIGGGNGYVSCALKNNGYHTVLVEPGVKGAHNAKARGLDPVICSSIEGAGFFEGTMPAIGLFDVLEHIEDDVDFLKKIRPLLVPGGRLYISVPSYRALWSKEDDFAGHHRRYRLKELTTKLKACGYEIDHATYFFMLLMLPILFFRTIPDKMASYDKKYRPKAEDEHKDLAGISGMLLDTYLKCEIALLKKSYMPFGASCLIVVRSGGS
jgi:SAM-dependent methyltransferase